MKVRLILPAVAVVVLLLGPWVIPVLRPWSAINCRHEEINIKTGQARYCRYLWFIKVSERVEDTTLSRLLAGASVDAADIEPWHKVNTFAPGTPHSPHYLFHKALAQVRELELILERYEPEAQRRRAIVREVLRLWQTTGRAGGAAPYLRSLAQTDAEPFGDPNTGSVPSLPGATA